MRGMLVLVGLIVLAAYPAIAAAPGDNGAKELGSGQKQNQERPALPPSARGVDGISTGGRVYDGESGW